MKYGQITLIKQHSFAKAKFKNSNDNQKCKKQYTGVISFNGTAQNFQALMEALGKLPSQHALRISSIKSSYS